MDSLLSTVQMPGDVPVVSVAVGMGGPRNAGLFAVQVLSTADDALRDRFAEFKRALKEKIAAKDAQLQQQLAEES
jgi:phosphoribosylcarboxyaminoimidazole (NCAIR) mutase